MYIHHSNVSVLRDQGNTELIGVVATSDLAVSEYRGNSLLRWRWGRRASCL